MKQSEHDNFEFSGFPVSVLRRPYQRTIGLTVKPSGLIRVTAARSAKERHILKFLMESRVWIEKVQGEFEALRSKYPPKKYLQGEGFLYRGDFYFLNYQKSCKKRHKIYVEDNCLHCEVPEVHWDGSHHIFPQPEVRGEFIKFYKASGRRVLEERVEKFSEEMNLYPKKLSFRSQKSRWGSCGSNGHVSLNWRLIAAPLEILDYVVIHELAHLKYQNHSSRFWGLVGQYCPEFSQYKKWLKNNQYEFDFLAKKSELWVDR